MIIEQELKNFKKILDKELARFLDKKIAEAGAISPVAVGAVTNLRNYILKSGKRIRPALIYHTYAALGGKNKKAALRAAMASEVMHAFLIIQDDVADKDDFRRGVPAIHYFYQKQKIKENRGYPDACHYGNSQAICVSDIAFSLVNEIIIDCRLNGRTKSHLFKKIGEIIFNTSIGQFYDIFAAAKKNISEKEVLKILEYKTARYTFDGPMQMAAIMAGASEKVLKNLSDFAIPLGIAFQIQDDILGVFGSSKETGKPVGADIREGKKTLLVVKASEFGDGKQKKELISLVGNPKISERQIERARWIIIETGSLEYSQNLAKKLVKRSDNALEKSGFSANRKKFFREVADFVIKRNH